MTTPLSNGGIYTDLQGLSDLKRLADKNSPEAMRAVARQFEAIFIQQIFKSMRDVNFGDDLFESDQMNMYLDMFDKQIALTMAEGKGMGLADVIYRQLSQTENIPRSQVVSARMAPVTVNLSTVSKRTHVPTPQSGAHTDTAAHQESMSLISENSPVMEHNSRQKTHNIAALNTVLNRIKAISDYSAALRELPSFDANTAHQANDLSVVPLLTEHEVQFSTPSEFVKSLWPLARRYAAELGVDPKVLLAQAALETGWGKSINRTADGENSHNLFNIKADNQWQGHDTSVSVVEYRNGIAIKEVGKFRVYDSYNAGFADYVDFLQSNSRYKEALTKVANTDEFVHALQQAGYATDPNYARKIMGILQRAPLNEGFYQDGLKLSMTGTIQPVREEPK